jgi:hypothetical protein
MERATIDRDTFVRPNARPLAGVRATLIAGTAEPGGSAYAATVSVGDYLDGQWVELLLGSRLQLQLSLAA